MLISTIMFYNHLFTAAYNPGFFTVVYFDYFGEGLIELIMFTIFIPFILIALFLETREVIKYGRKIKSRRKHI